jgi:hypothetical protein
VSRSFSDRVEVFLGPREIHLRRTPRGWRAQPGMSHSLACPSGSDASWQAAATTLEDALVNLAWTRADVAVTLSNHFVHYAIVPHVPGVKRADYAAVAQHQAESVYGEVARNWRIAFDEAARTSAALAAGVDPDFIARIEALLRTAGLRPMSIEPYLASAYNACRRTMNGAPAWLAVAEPGRVCVAGVRDGNWLAVRSQRIAGTLHEALPAVLEQARLTAAEPASAGRVYLVSREEASFDLPEGTGWSLEPAAWAH